MFADQVGGGLEAVVAWHELALGLQKIHEALGSEIPGRAGEEPRAGPECCDDVCEQAGAGVGFARLQHHLHDFMSVNLVHWQTLAYSRDG